MGCAQVTHLRLINSRFAVFYVKLDHFEAHLMVSSRVVDSKVPRMVIQREYFFFLIKMQKGECNVRNFRRFLFGMNPDVPAFKLRVLTSDFKFHMEVNMNIINLVDILLVTQIWSLFWLPLPYLFRKLSICVVDGFSLVWVITQSFNLHAKEWSKDMVSKIWAGMSTTNIHFYLTKNSRSLAKTQALNAGTSELIPMKIRLNFLTLYSPFCLFLIRYFN